MKISLKRTLALLLALVLAFALTACGEKEDDKSSGGGGLADLLSRVSPADDPEAYLRSSSEAAMEDLAQRYSGSPIAALSKLSGRSGTAEFSIDIGGEDESAQLGGTAGYDIDAGKLLLDAYIGYMGQQIDASLYADKDFLGVSVPLLLNSDSYYGFTPHDLYDQVSGSALGQYMESEDLEVFHQLDDMMAAFSSVDTSFIQDYTERVQKISNDLIASMDLEAREEKVTVNGETSDGWVIHAVTDAEDMADIFSSVTSAVFENSVWDSLSQIAAAAGEEIDLSEIKTEIDDTVEQIRASNVKFDYDYYIAGDKLVRIVCVPSGDGIAENITITIDLYEDDCVTVTMSNAGDELVLRSRPASGTGSYSHVLSMEYDGESFLITANWKDNRLELTLEMDGETVLGLTGGFGVSDKGFYLTDAVLTGDGIDEANKISINYTAGGTVSTPASLNNIFEMSEDELTNLIIGIYALTSM